MLNPAEEIEEHFEGLACPRCGLPLHECDRSFRAENGREVAAFQFRCGAGHRAGPELTTRTTEDPDDPLQVLVDTIVVAEV